MLKSPNDQEYVAIINDTTKKEEFQINRNVALKGKLLDNTIEVQKIISTDNDNFNLEGVTQSIISTPSGYRANIEGNHLEEYIAMFSLSNMGEKYKEYEVGDTISIIGDLWLNNTDLQVTVKDIK